MVFCLFSIFIFTKFLPGSGVLPGVGGGFRIVKTHRFETFSFFRHETQKSLFLASFSFFQRIPTESYFIEQPLRAAPRSEAAHARRYRASNSHSIII
ncbi:MAG: hypothetical protein [Cressdnaviricota sp.]|nr:MAG: hypothetical protein [Cressdnaviricota sp.]